MPGKSERTFRLSQKEIPTLWEVDVREPFAVERSTIPHTTPNAAMIPPATKHTFAVVANVSACLWSRSAST